MSLSSAVILIYMLTSSHTIIPEAPAAARINTKNGQVSNIVLAKFFVFFVPFAEKHDKIIVIWLLIREND